ncbi:pyridoxamine 5'-phosphate oxidase family protein [Pseudodesulfovibrio sediminis]|uniref:MFS transporter n=1 Tax=Pseudodesulfovibrio sediminis TaxID=2810563 RepID=A0ABM7PAI2_9BACT|nr:pyridoxamine 5'-phosphate oxidase family protein [Pseudodesulfovibrio sediminis]BCS90074.1 MFS transporter [Pseudodesulfovibrio sediminis]
MCKGYTDDKQIISAILSDAEVLWLALTDKDGPYCVPVNCAEEDGVIYIHSGMRGRKAACLNSGARVAFSTAVDVRMRKGGDDACDQGYLFRSVMGNGTPRLTEGDEKMRGLDLLTVKHLGKQLPYDEKYIPVTNVYAIDIETATARVKE